MSTGKIKDDQGNEYEPVESAFTVGCYYLRKVEKVKPMPEVLVGDAIWDGQQGWVVYDKLPGDYFLSVSNSYGRKVTMEWGHVLSVVREGVTIWSREP